MQHTQDDKIDGVTRYKWEYSKFLEMVQKKNIQDALIYSQMLSIDRRTLVHWMSQPELHDAILECVSEITEKMKLAGSKDWRMWRELMNILGIKDIKELDITSGGERLPTVIIENNYGNKPNFRVDNTAEADDMAEASNSESS